MLLVMPLMIGWMSLNFPSGLVIYWIVVNLYQLVQQTIMFREEMVDRFKGSAPKKGVVTVHGDVQQENLKEAKKKKVIRKRVIKKVVKKKDNGAEAHKEENKEASAEKDAPSDEPAKEEKKSSAADTPAKEETVKTGPSDTKESNDSGEAEDKK